MNYNIDKNALLLLEELKKKGINAWLVGGCVRDMIRGVEPNDWDITAEALPDDICAALSNHRLVLNGLKHGTVAAVVNGNVYEVTACRSDGSYSDMRHPDSVEFTRSLKTDLARRDFTVNAMAYNPETGLVDIFGGQDDIKAKKIRCVGVPEIRFTEDALRIMRALRFAASFGYTLEAETSLAAVEMKDNLDTVSAERKYAELKKLLCGDDAEKVLRTYPELVFKLLPKTEKMYDFSNGKANKEDLWRRAISGISRLPKDFALRLAYFLRDCGKPFCDEDDINFTSHAQLGASIAEEMLKNLRADNETVFRTAEIIRNHCITLDSDRITVKKYLNRMESGIFFDILRLREADRDNNSCNINAAREAAEIIIEDGECYSLKQLAVNGRDLAQLGLRGAEIGEKLAFLLNAVMEEKCPNEKNALLAFIS